MTELRFSKRKQTGRTRIYTPREERQQLVKECDTIWGKIIRTRDKVCQWCGSKKDGHGHHIIAKPRLKRMKNQTGRWDLNNGVRLCKACHFYRLKDYPDEYDAWLRGWLKTMHLTLEGLIETYKIPAKADLRLVKLQLQQEWDRIR